MVENAVTPLTFRNTLTRIFIIKCFTLGYELYRGRWQLELDGNMLP